MPETTQKTEEPRSLLDLQVDIAKQLRLGASYTNERDGRLRKLIVEVQARKAALETAQKAHLVAQANDPATQMLAMVNERLEALKQEAAESFDAVLERTWKEADGAGFQFRTKTVTVIADEIKLASHLIEEDLWERAGAALTIDAKLVAGLLAKKVPLPGVGLDVDVTVALYQPTTTTTKEN